MLFSSLNSSEQTASGFKIKTTGAGEISHQLRTLAAFPADLYSISVTHKGAHNHLEVQFQGMWCPCLASTDAGQIYVAQVYMQIKYPYTENKLNN